MEVRRAFSVGFQKSMPVRVTADVIKQDCESVVSTITSGEIIHERYSDIATRLKAGQETAAGFTFCGANNDLLLSTFIFKDESGEAGLGIALSHFTDGKESVPSDAYMRELSKYELALFRTLGQYHSAPVQFSQGKYRPSIDLPTDIKDAAIVRFKLNDANLDWRSPSFNEPLIYSALGPDQGTPYLFAAVKK